MDPSGPGWTDACIARSALADQNVGASADVGCIRERRGTARGMDATYSSKRETDALIEAIWGPKAADRPEAVDPVTRAAQNHALAEAIKAYLQAYLSDAHGPAPLRLDPPGPVA